MVSFSSGKPALDRRGIYTQKRYDSTEYVCISTEHVGPAVYIFIFIYTSNLRVINRYNNQGIQVWIQRSLHTVCKEVLTCLNRVHRTEGIWMIYYQNNHEYPCETAENYPVQRILCSVIVDSLVLVSQRGIRAKLMYSSESSATELCSSSNTR